MDKKSKQRVLHRLKILEGQVRGLQRQVEENTYCIDILTQTAAVKKALSGIEDVILESHLSSCVISQVQAGKNDQSTQEILTVYKLAKKK